MTCRSCMLALALASIVAVLPAARGYDYQWHEGRATNYGSAGDPWSIMHGSCGYGWLDQNVGTGWDVAALADSAPDFSGSCGRCYEISCNNMHVRDGYGQDLDRTGVCYDSSQSVVVMITDVCPCEYPPNYYSNKRWCCNDMYHFDMSRWAFEKLADPKWGVIGIKFRPVPCEHCPWNPAHLPSGASPSPQSSSQPDGWQASWDKRPQVNVCKSSGQASTSASASASSSGGDASASASASASSSSNGDASASASASSSSDSSNSGSSSSMPTGGMFSINGFKMGDLFSGALSGWRDWSFKLTPWHQNNSKDDHGNPIYCGTLDGYGASVFNADGGVLNGKRTLELVMKTFNGQSPAMTITLQSSKGDCRTLDLQQIQPNWNSEWVTYTIQLGSFSWDQGWQSSPVDFKGCSSSIGLWDVNQVQIKNKWGGSQNLCIDTLKFYS